MNTDNTSSILRLGVLGCGDILRWNKGDLLSSRRVRVSALFDPAPERATRWATELGGRVETTAEAVLEAADVDAVLLFVPPWVRRDLFLRALAAGKAVLTTKPLAPAVAECEELAAAARASSRAAGVLYNRSGFAAAPILKALLEGGEFGRLALYRQDWLHHYPQWNDWATDPVRNGGPFMDAMIHNLNLARHLFGRPVTHATFTSAKLAHPDLRCADTEAMQIEFSGGGLAHLFITWAADLAVHSTQGNDREHHDLGYMVTERGWHLTTRWRDGKLEVRASRLGEERIFPCPGAATTLFDEFAAHVLDGAAWPARLPTVDEAAEDIALIRAGMERPGDRLQT